MSIELTEEQRQAVLKGEALRCSGEGIGANLVLLREDVYQTLLEDQEDRQVQQAFLHASHQSSVSWMKDNPY